ASTTQRHRRRQVRATVSLATNREVSCWIIVRELGQTHAAHTSQAWARTVAAQPDENCATRKSAGLKERLQISNIGQRFNCIYRIDQAFGFIAPQNRRGEIN